MATVRYLVGDVDRSIAFYTQHLGFTLEQQMGPAFARVSSGDLTLWLAGPQSSAARPMPDGQRPEAGGWNRIVVEATDLVAQVAEMKKQGLRFRNEIVIGPGGKQILLEDPDGNPIELFEAARADLRCGMTAFAFNGSVLDIRQVGSAPPCSRAC
jgi:catechol 2,3-dioxygenase-like lactoylglutathione lyase family enzyme